MGRRRMHELVVEGAACLPRVLCSTSSFVPSFVHVTSVGLSLAPGCSPVLRLHVRTLRAPLWPSGLETCWLTTAPALGAWCAFTMRGLEACRPQGVGCLRAGEPTNRRASLQRLFGSSLSLSMGPLALSGQMTWPAVRVVHAFRLLPDRTPRVNGACPYLCLTCRLLGRASAAAGCVPVARICPWTIVLSDSCCILGDVPCALAQGVIRRKK